MNSIKSVLNDLSIKIYLIMSANIQLWFGKIAIPLSQVFLIKKAVYAMVNLRPFVPGHVLVCPIKNAQKLEDL